MNLKILSLSVFIVILYSCKSKNQNAITGDHIDVFDEDLLKHFNFSIPPDTLGSGYIWSEGPVYSKLLHKLLFNDIPPNILYQWSENEGVSIYLQPSGYTGLEEHGGEQGANGLIIDDKDRLILCQHGDRRVAAMDSPLNSPEPKFITLASHYNGKKLNSPNDLCISGSGHIYFTDPPYGIGKNEVKELDFQGVYRIDVNGGISLLTDTLTRPNGIALSPDEKTLFIANSDPAKPFLYAFDLDDDEGLISNGRIFYDMTQHVPAGRGLPDGLKIHSLGFIFTTGPGGVHILNMDGKPLGRIKTLKAVSNCAFGPDENELFLTNHDLLLRVYLQ
ncbi:MAG TPA: SMP-30/gluconolactonase/LRE family protein [Saprospiraceae bacterium]|nr:SMP-30/gluconolactonase/LRE family protein [Saprospiraceae bacterium]